VALHQLLCAPLVVLGQREIVNCQADCIFWKAI
jgi:hypothetical protein